MQVFHVYIDELRFTFVDREPVEELKRRVIQASHDNGDFVSITQSSRPPSEVFVTSQTRIRIETASIPREPTAATEHEEDDSFWFDFDSLS